MLDTSLHFGTHKAAEAVVPLDKLANTVGELIECLLDADSDKRDRPQIRAAAKDPNAIIEICSGEQVQIATPNMPVRELLSPESSKLEITVSKPHVGG